MYDRVASAKSSMRAGARTRLVPVASQRQCLGKRAWTTAKETSQMKNASKGHFLHIKIEERFSWLSASLQVLVFESKD